MYPTDKNHRDQFHQGAFNFNRTLSVCMHCKCNSGNSKPLTVDDCSSVEIAINIQNQHKTEIQ